MREKEQTKALLTLSIWTFFCVNTEKRQHGGVKQTGAERRGQMEKLSPAASTTAGGGATFSFAGCLNQRSSQLLLLPQENPPVRCFTGSPVVLDISPRDS